MLEATCRPALQRVVIQPLAEKMAGTLSANQLTLLSLALGLLVIPALVWVGAWLATALLLLSGLCDVLDGSVARIRGESSAIGSVYDILADRAVEAAAVIALTLTIPNSGLLAVLMLSAILLCVSSFLLAAIHTPADGDKSFHYSAGFMERAEAFMFFVLMIWLPEYFTLLAILFIVLTLLTAVIRMRELATQLMSVTP